MKTLFAAGIISAAVMLAPTAHADPTWQGRTHPSTPTYTVHPGIAHGKGKHHRAGFCVDDAPHICQPGNSEGKPAACYDDGGVIVAYWPCNPWTPDMGHRHADGTTTYPNGDVLTDDGEDAALTVDPDEAVYDAGYTN